jgi:hypothetical protein
MINAKEYNRSVYNMIKQGGDGIAEFTDATTSYLRTKIREDSFARKILPPAVIGPEDTQRNPDGKGGLIKIEEREPENGKSVILDFRGEPETYYVTGDIYSVRFFKVSTPKNSININDLLTYHSPITSIVRTNSEKEMAKTEDEFFMKLVNASLTAVPENVVTSSETVLNKKVISAGLKQFSAKQLQGSVMLMPKSAFYDFQALDQSIFGAGDILGQVVVNGYTYPTIMGIKYVTTIKEDLLDPHSVYLFTDPEYLGKSYKLGGDINFMMERHFSRLEYLSEQTMGMAIGNAKAVVKVTWTA